MLSQDERDPLPHSSPDYILKAYVYLNIHDKGVWYFNPYLFLPYYLPQDWARSKNSIIWVA